MQGHSVCDASFVTVFQRLARRLLDDAPREEVDSEIVACLESIEALPAEERSAARVDVDLIVELRGLIDKYRRRSRELRALYETAGDLSSVRDTEGVLQAIVRRGRQLLDTDVAYLMLVDEESGDTYMRVTEGTTSPEFREIRLPFGAGLGGLVAQELAPYWTRNYLADDRYIHVIDGIVAEEKLVAILGVPLKIGRRLLGVLFAAERGEREFSQDEVSLFASLADHAAIAIDNAALFQETREAVAALSSAKRTIEANSRRLEIAIELHERLMALVIEGGSIQDLANALVQVIGGAVIVLDDEQRELGRATMESFEIDEAYSAVLRRLTGSDVSRRSTRSEVENLHAVVTPVVTGADTLGFLVYLSGDVRDDVVRSLERATAVIALLLLNRRAGDEADNRVRGEILAELLISSPHDVEAIERRARLLHVDLDQKLVVLVLLPRSGAVSRTLQAESGALARAARGLVTSYADRVVMLLAGHEAEESAKPVVRRLRHLEVTVGASGPISDLLDVSYHEDRARRSATVLVALGRTGEAASSEQLGIYGLLLSEAGQEHVRAFIHRCLGPVRCYDEARGTALVATLDAYFASETNVAGAAELLFVHVNTLYQRLERLDRILGPDWRTGDRALEIRLALRMSHIMEGSIRRSRNR